MLENDYKFDVKKTDYLIPNEYIYNCVTIKPLIKHHKKKNDSN